jgi:hypothetical protein
MSTQLRDANPYSDEQVDALALHGEDALREAILRHRVRPRRRWQWAGITAGMVATGATLIVLLVGGSTPERAWSAEAVRVAESVPRLLLPGWEVVRADEFSVDEGEMTFARGELTLDLLWTTGESFAAWRKDRADESRRLPDVGVPGGRAIVFAYLDSDRDYRASWLSGPYRVELRVGNAPDGQALSPEEFARTAASLRAVNVDEWLSAMPPSAVIPVDSEKVVAEILDGVPVPENFDTTRLADDGVRDRYQLSAKVIGAVACAWIAQYYEGDRAEAAAALRTVTDWKALEAMRSQGAYPEVLVDHVDAVLGDGTIIGGKKLQVREVYKAALGC